MIALLPVSRYRVRYQVAAGRPYSFFERYILEAITEGHSSLDALADLFRVHRRALIEGVITLIQAGWVAIDRSSHELLPTVSGKRAIAEPDELPRNIVVVDQTDFILGERVRGQVAKGADVTFSARSELRKYMLNAVVIPTGNVPHPLEPGILVPLLRTREGEWIRSCGPIDIIRDGADFVVVDVDTSSETITGIPSKWVPLLRDELLGRARAKELQLMKEGITYSTDSSLKKLVRTAIRAANEEEVRDPDEWVLDASVDRTIVGGGQHRSMLEHWLETARSYIAIVSRTLDSATVEQFDALIRAAVKRGVLVDVLWGEQDMSRPAGDHARAVDLLRKIEWDSYHATGRGRLTIARKPTGSRANVLFSDVSDTFETVVGSCNWLGTYSPGPAIDLSIAFSEHEPASRIGRLIADLASFDERLHTGVGLTRLRHAVADLGRQVAERVGSPTNEQRTSTSAIDDIKSVIDDHDMSDETSTEEQGVVEVLALPAQQDAPVGAMRARIIVGRQHQAVIPLLTRYARQHVIIGSHRWGRDSEIVFRSLQEALERGCGKIDVRFGIEVDSDNTHAELALLLQKLGGRIQQIADSRARFAVADDDTAVVTTYDWLCPELEARKPVGSDIGFMLRGTGVGSALLDKLGIRPLDARVQLQGEYITSFRIERLRSVNRLEWQAPPGVAAGWHVIVGDNGSGKTSVLRALALTLIGSENAQGLRQEWGAWLRGGTGAAEVQVDLQQVVTGPIKTESLSVRSVALRWEHLTDEGVKFDVVPEEYGSVPSAGYGPFRRFTGGDPDYEKQLATVPELARHISLFNERVALTESLAWLRDLRFKALESNPEATLLLDRVTKLINESGLFPAGVHLTQITSDAVMFKDDSEYEFSTDDLSDGYRSILSLTLDIVRQLALHFGPGRVFHPEHQHIVAAPGIVLIDEVDAHLHPSWQRTVGQWFRTHFPLIQFIVTTHSPLVCQAAETGSVYRLPDPMDETDHGEMLDGPARARLVYGNILEAYASGAFGDGITRSEASKSLMQRLADLNRKEMGSTLSTTEQVEQEQLRKVLPLAAHSNGGG